MDEGRSPYGGCASSMEIPAFAGMTRVTLDDVEGGMMRRTGVARKTGMTPRLSFQGSRKRRPGMTWGHWMTWEEE